MLLMDAIGASPRRSWWRRTGRGKFAKLATDFLSRSLAGNPPAPRSLQFPCVAWVFLPSRGAIAPVCRPAVWPVAIWRVTIVGSITCEVGRLAHAPVVCCVLSVCGRWSVSWHRRRSAPSNAFQ